METRELIPNAIDEKEETTDEVKVEEKKTSTETGKDEETDKAENKEEDKEKKPEEKAEEKPTNPLFEKIKEKYPDKEFASDEDYLKTVYEENEQLNDYKEKRESEIKVVRDLWESDQPYFDVTKLMHQKKMPFLPAVFQTIGIEEMEDILEAVKKGEDGVEELVKATKENKKMKDTQKTFYDTMHKNRQDSIQVMKDFQESKGYSDEQMGEYKDFVDKLLNPVWEGKFTKEFFEFFDKAMNHDKELKKTEELARAQEKNKKIEEEELKREKKNVLPNVKSTEKPFEGNPEKKGDKVREFFESVNKTLR